MRVDDLSDPDDLAALNFAGLLIDTEIDGVIGGDILHQYEAVIDYSNARLILSFRDSDLS